MTALATFFRDDAGRVAPMLALRAAQAVLVVSFYLTAPTIVARLIQIGGTALRDATGW